MSAHVVAMIASLALPHPDLTPGAIDPSVTQSNIASTICKPGYTGNVRPSEYYTNQIKLKLLPLYGHHTDNPLDFELDHLISLEIGGAPADEKNLWPEPYAGTWGARKKDVVERKLNRLVCNGKISLRKAQSAISTDWIAAYKLYVTTRKVYNESSSGKGTQRISPQDR